MMTKSKKFLMLMLTLVVSVAGHAQRRWCKQRLMVCTTILIILTTKKIVVILV